MPVNRKRARKAAAGRVRYLVSKAAQAENTQRLASLALRISQRNRLKMPSDLKRRYCKICKAFFEQGRNCRVRLSKGNVIYYCFSCKGYSRYRYKR